METENKDLNLNNEDLEEEIDLKILFFTLLRNKKFIIIVTLISSIFGFLNFNSRKTLWEGSLNILFKEKYKPNKKNKVFLFEIADGFKKSKDPKRQIFNVGEIIKNQKKFVQDAEEIKTNQKIIISSPSVLMPVYDYDQKFKKKNKSNYSKISYKDWKLNTLKYDFIENTSLLSIKYRSSNKTHLLKALNLISTNYQDYFKINNKINSDNIISNLENQINLIRKKRISSLDQIILTFLEDEIESVKIAQINNDPWQRIYKPFIKNTPIKKKKFHFEFIYLPFFISSLIVLFKEKIYGNIFDIEVLKKNIPYKLIEIIYVKDSFIITSFLINKISLDSDDNVAIIEISNEFFDNNNDLIRDDLNFKFINFKNLTKLKNFKNVFLIAEKGKIDSRNLKLLTNYLIMYKEKINGYFIIDA